MKRILILFPILSILLFSCGETEEQVVENPVEASKPGELNLDFDQRAKREVEAKLQIPRNERYTFQVYKEYINADSIQDAIITVNRYDFAINEAIHNGKQAKMAEIGFLGNYNFFFYYDGATDQFSVPLPVASSAGRPLDVRFQTLVSPTQKDVIIGYRIRNSGWSCYYSVLNETDLGLVFRWKNFDYVGEDTPEAFLFDYEDSKEYIGKDILIYTSEIDGYSKNVTDIYHYIPSITKRNKLEYRFYFDERYGKFKLYSYGPGSEHADEIRQRSKK